jgi:hypothetical protein
MIVTKGGYKLSYNNGRDLFKLESNKFVNGKRVQEPETHETVGNNNLFLIV